MIGKWVVMKKSEKLVRIIYYSGSLFFALTIFLLIGVFVDISFPFSSFIIILYLLVLAIFFSAAILLLIRRFLKLNSRERWRSVRKFGITFVFLTGLSLLFTIIMQQDLNIFTLLGVSTGFSATLAIFGSES